MFVFLFELAKSIIRFNFHEKILQYSICIFDYHWGSISENPKYAIITLMSNWSWTNVSYLVTLNVLSRRTHLNTDSPSGCIISFLVRTSSAILLITTKKSNRLKRETKYPWNEICVLYKNIDNQIIFFLFNNLTYLNTYS